MGLYETFHPVVFLWSLLWGVYLYLVYEAFHFIRVMLKERKTVTFICDILFMIVSAFFMFIFSLAYNFGQLRVYMIFGVVISFAMMKLTAGRLITLLFQKIYTITGLIIVFFSKIFKKLTNKLLKLYSILVYNLGKKKDKNKGMNYEKQ